MEKLEEFKIFNGDTKKGKVFYYSIENNIGFGLLENENYLLLKNNKYFEIKKDLELFRDFLPLLELDIINIEKDLKKNGLNIFYSLPIEKIILTAFHKGFSIYWKEKAILWLEKLDYNSSNLRDNILPLASRESNLPISIKKRIKILLKKID